MAPYKVGLSISGISVSCLSALGWLDLNDALMKVLTLIGLAGFIVGLVLILVCIHYEDRPPGWVLGIFCLGRRNKMPVVLFMHDGEIYHSIATFTDQKIDSPICWWSNVRVVDLRPDGMAMHPYSEISAWQPMRCHDLVRYQLAYDLMDFSKLIDIDRRDRISILDDHRKRP